MKTKLRTFIKSLCAATALFAVTQARAEDKYVATEITDTLNIEGIGIVTATHTNLQEAINDTTTVAGDTIWVQDGYIFDEAFGHSSDPTGAKTRLVINKDIIVRSISGHYNGGAKIIGAWHSDSSPWGDNSVRGVYLGSSAELIGFTVEKGTTRNLDGQHGYGGGVHIHDAASTIRFCHITKGYAMAGGAVGSTYSATIYDSLISESNASGNWGAMYNKVKAERCTFLNNPNRVISETRGNTMTDCIFVGNGGPLGSSAATYNCIFSNNTSSVVVNQGTHYNAVFINNDGTAASGGTFYSTTFYNNGTGVSGSATLYNSISYGNTNPDSGATYYYSYSHQAATGNGNIDTALYPDPKIKLDDATGLPALFGNSPCVNAGNNDYKKTDTDILGQDRINQDVIEIGAVEFYFSNTSIEVAATPKKYGTPTPPYGPAEGYSVGDTVTATIADATDLTDPEIAGYKYSCVGYEVHNLEGELVDSKRFQEGDPLEASYEHVGWTCLTWIFEPSKVLITTHSDDSAVVITSADGSATYADGWVPYNSEIKLTAPVSEDTSFVIWAMDTAGIDGALTQNTITFTANRPRTIRAAYRFNETPEGHSYVSTLGSTHRQYGTGYTDLQTAIDSTPRGGTVWVEDGFFVGEEAGYHLDPRGLRSRIVVTNAITLRSVSGTKDSEVIIDGKIGNAKAVRCLYIGDEAVAFGITLQNGTAQRSEDAGGVCINHVSSTISNSVIRACTGSWGGGIATLLNGIIISDCIVSNNYCQDEGAGFWASSSYPNFTVTNCIIANNSGAEITCNSRGTFKYCTFTGNSAPLSAPPTYYCIFTNNTSSTIIQGGSHYNDVYMDNNCASGVATAGAFYNCTVYNNKSTGTISGLNLDAKAYNTISWGNANATTVTWYNSCAAEAAEGESCITEDPDLIIDEATGLSKFRNGNSPCINQGRDKASGVGDYDIFGNQRISGGRIDIGAAEYNAGGDNILVVSAKLYDGNTTADVRLGTSTPDYGTYEGYIPGTTTVAATMTATDDIEDEVNYPGYRFKCIGYTIYENADEPTANEERSGTTTTFNYTHQGWATLEWKFEKSYVLITTTTSGGGVQGAGWVPYNENVTLTAPEVEGMTFVRWSGDTTGINAKDNPVTFTATKPITLRAVYTYNTAPENYVYVSESGAAHPEYGAGYLNINKAIQEVPEGGTVWIEDGTVIDDADGFVMDSGHPSVICRVNINRNVTVRSVSGTIESGVIIRGAYHNDEHGIKNGPNAIRCAYVAYGGSLIGVICEHGAASAGTFSGGVYIGSSKSTLSHVLVRDSCGEYNGGITIGANATITDCVVSNNTCGGYGSGIFGVDGPGDIFTAIRCRVEGCRDGSLTYDSRGTFIDCVFTNNSVGFGTATTYNSTFVDSTGAAGGTHYGTLFINNRGTAAGGGKYYNCTFYNNVKGAQNSVLINSISAENTNLDTGCIYTNSCSEAITDLSNGNINTPARLILDKDGIPVPHPGSPCVDAGDITLVQDAAGNLILKATDIRGKKRIRAGHLDLGAAESAPQATVIRLE